MPWYNVEVCKGETYCDGHGFAWQVILDIRLGKQAKEHALPRFVASSKTLPASSFLALVLMQV